MFVLNAIPSALGAAAVVPPLFYLMSLTFLDGRREPPLVVVLTFLLGSSAIFGLRLLHVALDPIMLIAQPDIGQAFLLAFGGIAAPEEAVKVVLLLLFSQRYMAPGHPMEGVVYGAAMGLGFAAYENLGLLVTQPESWQQHMVIRSLVTVPVHAALGIIAGIYIARARAAHLNSVGARDAWKNYAAAWLLPTVLHGLYDFPLLVARSADGTGVSAGEILRGIGFMVATALILLAARRAYRIASTQHLKTGPFGAGWPMGYRAWRQHILGGFIGFAGALMVFIEIEAWVRHEPFAFDRHIIIIIGSIFLTIALFHHRRALHWHRANLHHGRQLRSAA